MINNYRVFAEKARSRVQMALLIVVLATILSLLIVVARSGGRLDARPSTVRSPSSGISEKGTPVVSRHLALTNPGPALRPEEITAFEREISGRLPDDYKEFMLAHNGGIVEPLLRFMWKGEPTTLPDFDPLLPPACEDRGNLRQSLRRLHDLNPETTDGFLPIATTFGGQYICLAMRGQIGAVFYTEYTYQTVYLRDLVPVDVAMAPLAGSFTEFLDSLTEVPPEPYCRIAELGKKGTPEDLAEFLAEGNSIDAEGKNKLTRSKYLTVLLVAIAADNQPMIRACIERGASLSGTIHAVVQYERPHLIEMLLRAGADINEKDEFGTTPLAHVCGTALPGKDGAKNRELYDLLVKLGAVGGKQ